MYTEWNKLVPSVRTTSITWLFIGYVRRRYCLPVLIGLRDFCPTLIPVGIGEKQRF